MKIVFAAMHALLDPSSGAAHSVRTMLRHLGRLGGECHAITPSVYDSPLEPTAIRSLAALGAVPTNPGSPAASIWRCDEDGLRHHLLPLAIQERGSVRPADEVAYLNFASDMLAKLQPDILIQYGGSKVEIALARTARQRGALTVFYLANPTYWSAESFSGSDLVVTDTEATARLYEARLGLAPLVVGKFVDPLDVPPGVPDRITFVNPAPVKGGTLFFRIAELANKAYPDMRFLVVEGRGCLDELERTTGLPFSRLPNIERIGLQRDLGKVFARTAVLLMPSVWHESGPRTAIEALHAGIPVLASDVGGIPELMGAGAELLPVPPALRQDPLRIPSPTSAILWVEALHRLSSAGPYRRRAIQHARRIGRRMDAASSARRLWLLFSVQRAAARQRGSIA